MAYIRISIAKPRQGQEERFEALMRRLTEVTKQQPGCVESYLLHPHDDSGELARVSIYDNEASAGAAAQSDTIMALRSEMHILSEPGHTERAFHSI